MTIDVRLFGPFHLTHNGQALDAINGSPRLQALLAYLLLHHDRPQPRQQIAYHFWPVSEESQARTNLRKLFLQLRRALPNADNYLTFDNQVIQWQTNAPFTCDVVEVQQLLKHLHTAPLDRDALTTLFELYRGELLPNCYDDWIAPLRERLHRDVMAALDQLVTLLENQRAYGEGIRSQPGSHGRIGRCCASTGKTIGSPYDREEILAQLETHKLDHTEEVLQVYRTCYRVLQALDDPRSLAILQAMYDQLQARAATIDDPEHRRMFWEAMPGHREICATWAQLKRRAVDEGGTRLKPC